VAWHAQFGDALAILLFPSDEFGQQELESSQVGPFISSTYGLPTASMGCTLMAKVPVNGPDAHPVWKFAKTAFPGEVRWNFAAWFVFDREGAPAGRYEINQLHEVELVLSRLISSA